MPRRSIRYSQNFLKSPSLVSALLDTCGLCADDVVYEIGPGKGIITEQLARRCKRVVAVEKDPCLAILLLRRFAERSNVTISQGDFLEYCLPRTPYKVVANIPFNITAAIVTRLTAAQNPPEDAYLAMQREAAEMFLGTPRESLRSVLLKPWFEMEITHHFRREDFLPAPRVDVVMLRLRKRGPPLVSNADRQLFRDFATYLFTARRPTLAAALHDTFTRPQLKRLTRELHVDLAIPLTSLTFEQWLPLFEHFKTIGHEPALRLIAGSERRLLHQQRRLQNVHRTRPSSKHKPRRFAQPSGHGAAAQ